MKNNKLIRSLILLILIMLALNITSKLKYSMYNLPKGEYITKSTSPNGVYTIKLYLCSGNSTVDFSVRGELITNSFIKKKKNIYWQYKTDESNITWITKQRVLINGTEIKVPDGKYDWRVENK